MFDMLCRRVPTLESAGSGEQEQHVPARISFWQPVLATSRTPPSYAEYTQHALRR